MECVAKRNKPQMGHCRDRLITELQSAEVHAQFQTAVTTAVEALDLDSDLPERLDAALADCGRHVSQGNSAAA